MRTKERRRRTRGILVKAAAAADVRSSGMCLNTLASMFSIFEALALSVFTLQMNFHKTLAPSVESYWMATSYHWFFFRALIDADAPNLTRPSRTDDATESESVVNVSVAVRPSHRVAFHLITGGGVLSLVSWRLEPLLRLRTRGGSSLERAS